MTPEEAVARLAGILAADAELSESDIYAQMAERGIPAGEADRAYKFTQLAWGRRFLDLMGMRFSPDYFCFNGAGDVIESGATAQEAYYQAAVAMGPRVTVTPGFLRLAVMSSEVNAVNAALNAGSKPQDLVGSPVAMFLEPATPEGMEKARRAITEHAMSRLNVVSIEKKPWWEFWKKSEG
jgi:hypothetical protein